MKEQKTIWVPSTGCEKRQTSPVPLSVLGEYFGFSPVSIHEMVQKLSQRGWIVYHPYRGVTLTESGEEVALALLRRHRLWERFLTDMLHVPWDEAHEMAGNLEHAAPESVTERLAELLGDPDSCPHGEPIPPSERHDHRSAVWMRLPEGTVGTGIAHCAGVRRHFCATFRRGVCCRADGDRRLRTQ